MTTCVIQYTFDPHRADDFEKYATTCPPIIERCGGQLVGYYSPKEGANNFVVALIDFNSLATYEQYRERLATDPDPGRTWRSPAKPPASGRNSALSCARSDFT
jgi:hypothetical protein